jgi:hypothetical protein
LTDDRFTANTAGQADGAFIDLGLASSLTNVTMTGEHHHRRQSRGNGRRILQP